MMIKFGTAAAALVTASAQAVSPVAHGPSSIDSSFENATTGIVARYGLPAHDNQAVTLAKPDLGGTWAVAALGQSAPGGASATGTAVTSDRAKALSAMSPAELAELHKTSLEYNLRVTKDAEVVAAQVMAARQLMERLKGAAPGTELQIIKEYQQSVLHSATSTPEINLTLQQEREVTAITARVEKAIKTIDREIDRFTQDKNRFKDKVENDLDKAGDSKGKIGLGMLLKELPSGAQKDRLKRIDEFCKADQAAKIRAAIAGDILRPGDVASESTLPTGDPLVEIPKLERDSQEKESLVKNGRTEIGNAVDQADPVIKPAVREALDLAGKAAGGELRSKVQGPLTPDQAREWQGRVAQAQKTAKEMLREAIDQKHAANSDLAEACKDLHERSSGKIELKLPKF